MLIYVLLLLCALRLMPAFLLLTTLTVLCTDIAGIPRKLKSEPMRLEKAIEMCAKRRESLRQSLQTDNNQLNQRELVMVRDLCSALQ